MSARARVHRDNNHDGQAVCQGGVVVSWNPAIGTLKPFHQPFSPPAFQRSSHSRYVACAPTPPATPPRQEFVRLWGCSRAPNVLLARPTLEHHGDCCWLLLLRRGGVLRIRLLPFFSFFLSFAAVILLPAAVFTPAADTSGDTFIYVVGLDSRRGRIIGPGSFARSFFSTFSPTLSPSPSSIFSILLVLEKLDFSSNSYVVRKFCSSCIIMDVITRFSRFTHALFTIVRVAWGIRRGYARIRDLVRDFIVGYDFNSRAHK